MLYLTRKPGETIVINDSVEITVVSVSGKAVKLGFNFPPGVSVLRKEVFDRIQSENRAAAKTSLNLSTLQVNPLPPPPESPPDSEEEP